MLVCGSEHEDVSSKAAAECGLPLSSVLLLQSAPTWSLESLDHTVSAISSGYLKWDNITDPQALKESLITILWSSGTTGESYEQPVDFDITLAPSSHFYIVMMEIKAEVP